MCARRLLDVFFFEDKDLIALQHPHGRCIFGLSCWEPFCQVHTKDRAPYLLTSCHIMLTASFEKVLEPAAYALAFPRASGVASTGVAGGAT